MNTSQPVESVNSFQSSSKTRMSEMHGCFALVWTRGISEGQESDILQDVETVEGVKSARFTRKGPHILLASYDPDLTNTAKILKAINRNQIQARIVGC